MSQLLSANWTPSASDYIPVLNIFVGKRGLECISRLLSSKPHTSVQLAI